MEMTNAEQYLNGFPYETVRVVYVCEVEDSGTNDYESFSVI